MSGPNLSSYSPSEWEYGRMQGNLEAQINGLQNELQTLTTTIEDLEKEECVLK